MRFSLLLLLLYVMCVQFNSNFLLFIRISIGFCLVILHSSSFVILSVYFIFIIRLKHLFINVCHLLVIWLVVFQVSHPYNNTDFTLLLNTVQAYLALKLRCFCTKRVLGSTCPITFPNINPLKPELNPICYLLALLGAHHFLHVSRIRVKLLTLRLLMSYIYMLTL